MDTDDRQPLRIDRSYDAPVDRVFRAWTAPAELARWVWGSLGKEVVADVDLRVGGELRVTTARPDGGTWILAGRYVEIVPDARLVHTLHWSAPMGYTTPEERVTVEFTGDAGRTAVVFLHEGVPGAVAREEHRKGWMNAFDVLETCLCEA